MCIGDAVQLGGCLEVVKYVFKDVQKKSLDLHEFIRMTECEVTLTALVSALDCKLASVAGCWQHSAIHCAASLRKRQ